MLNKDMSCEHYRYLKKIKRRKQIITITQVSIFVLTLILWEIAARMKLIDTFLTSSPSDIWNMFLHMAKNGNLAYHVGISIFENIVGFTVGTILGVIIAIGLWWSDFWAKVLEPYLVVLNTLPKTALAPIIIIWIGTGYSGIIVTAVVTSIVITIMNMFNSFISADENKIKLLKTFGASKLQIFTKLVFPQSIPAMISTLKVNIGLSWIGVIVGEFLVSRAGIGYLLVYGGQVFQFDLIMMSLFILTIISVLMYKLVSIIENKFINWHQ